MSRLIEFNVVVEQYPGEPATIEAECCCGSRWQHGPSAGYLTTWLYEHFHCEESTDG